MRTHLQCMWTVASSAATDSANRKFRLLKLHDHSMLYYFKSRRLLCLFSILTHIYSSSNSVNFKHHHSLQKHDTVCAGVSYVWLTWTEVCTWLCAFWLWRETCAKFLPFVWESGFCKCEWQLKWPIVSVELTCFCVNSINLLVFLLILQWLLLVFQCSHLQCLFLGCLSELSPLTTNVNPHTSFLNSYRWICDLFQSGLKFYNLI